MQYAYAVTVEGALKMYQEMVGGARDIITVYLRAWCESGLLRCVTVFPELFHHHKKAGEIASEIAVQEGWDDLAAPVAHGYTANIRYSARCNSKSLSAVQCQEEE